MSKTPETKAWEMPEWVEPYRSVICNTGGNSIESLMNDKSTNMHNNAVRSVIIACVSSQINLLAALHETGCLRELD